VTVSIKDKAKSAFNNVDNKRIKRDTSLYNTFATLKLALKPTKSINIFSL